MNLIRGFKNARMGLFMLYCLFAGNSKFFTAIFSAVCEYSAAIGSCHSFTKSVFILSFSA